ncbi:MAG: hypothetical protein COA88_04480 [Kordia sp.]|nr:MAG: hypothetical protein COA88_04480 [Kordia sp.]
MLKQFFIICSGADTDLLDNCSKGEQTKYAGIGATVFFTAVMAFIAASYALYSVFDTLIVSIGFGLVWGLLIFNLDRFIVSTIKKRDNFMQELLQATPRIILAMIIAVVISKPLELKIFEKEINQVLLEEKNTMTLENKDQIALQYTPKIVELTSQKESLKKEVSQKENEVNALYSTYIAEAEGREGTKLLGKGPVYNEKRNKHDAMLLELQELKTTNKEKTSVIESQIATLNTTYETQLLKTQPIIDGFDGLMARVNALGKLAWLPSFFIFILFLAIETSPILAKLLAHKSEYDFKLENQESAVKNWVQQQVHERQNNLKTNNAISNKVYADIQEAEESYQYKKKKAEELIRLQANVFYENQKNATV